MPPIRTRVQTPFSVPMPLARRVLAGAMLLSLACALPSRTAAQVPAEANPLAQAYNEAMAAFSAGNWAAAAAGFEKTMKLVADDKAPQMPPLLYMAGASYFNAPDFPKAIETFGKYLAKFPNGEKALEVRLGVARSNLRAKNYDEAAKLFEQLEKIPALRDEALSSQVEAYREGGKPEQAIAVLERLIAPEIRTSTQASGAITLAQLYADKKDPAKAIALLQKLETKTALVENLVALNGIAIKLGDEFLGDKRFAEALAAYRAVRSRDEVVKFQRNRIAMTEARIDANVKGAVGNPQLMAQVQMTNSQLKESTEIAKKLLEEFEKLPDFSPTLLFRMARCWYDWDKRWESIVVYDRILTKYPEAKEREPALFGMLIAYGDTGQVKRCQQFCEQYLKEFPAGPNSGTVGYLSGAVALQAQDFKSAESFFGVMLEKVPNSEFKEEMRFLLGNTKFMQGKYDEALKDYQKYLADFPAGKELEEATYRIALCHVFGGKYEEAMGLLNAFLQKYPQGTFASDGKYRLAVCKYAASLYDEVIKDCEAWVRQYANNAQQGEVDALLGDSLAAQDKLKEAIVAYQRSSKNATTDEVLNYSLFEASKHLQKLGQWSEVSRMFEEFVKDKPDHPAVVSAMYWIGRARAKDGKQDEAKAFLVENLKKYIGEPKREAVELLLQQLAQLCAKRPRPAASAVAPSPVAAAIAKPTGIASPAPATPVPATPPPYDAYAELAKQTKPLEDTTNTTSKARLLYAKAELAKLTKKPADAERIFLEISERFKPEDLSPVLLAQVGDFLLGRGELDRAAALFERLKEDFPKSDYLDYAYVGLGEVALDRKEVEKALEFFTDAIEKIGATSKLKEATLGRAKALLALSRYDESKKLFEQVASVREWRGDSTAFAVFSLGEIEARQGKYAEAIAHYRRVFVAYQRYLPWVAKSYLRAAESFDKMGKRQDAIDNLKEMLRNEKLVKFPEIEEAKKRLQEWGTPA